MSFLAPWFLLLSAAAAVPLLLHLMRRRIGTRVEFPAVRYLARAEREHSRTLRLRNLLLMLVRVAAVALIALAASRPAARLFSSGHGPTAFAVVLDNSLSTSVIENGRPLFAHLDDLARRAFSQSARGDRLWLVTADGVAHAGSAAELRDFAQRTSPLSGAGDPARALVRAIALVRSAGLGAAQVALITDGQKSSWTSAPDLGSVPVVAWLPSGVPPVNRAVVSAEAQPMRWTPRGAVVARVQAADSTTYRILLGSRTLARGTTAPGDEIRVRAAPPERGWLAGTVELDADELPGDNVRHFAVWVGAAPRVHVSADAGPFVASAIDVLRGDARVADGSQVSVVSADGFTTMPALIVAPSDPVRVGAANRALEGAGVPWRFSAPIRSAATAAGSGIGTQRVSLRYTLRHVGSNATDTLARVGAEPWIVAGGGYVIVASPLDPSATTFPVSATFVPWLADIMADRLSGNPGRAIAVTPGAHVAWPAWADALEGVPVAAASDTDMAVPAQTGTYFFMRNGTRVGALVVNADAGESTLDRWPASDFGRLLGAHAQVRTDDARFEASLFDVSSRASVVLPLLVALLVVLLMEATLAARGAGGER